MFTITLPPLLHDAPESLELVEALPEAGAAHVEIDASLVALADSRVVGDLMGELISRGLEVLVVEGAQPDLRSSFLDAAERHDFGEIWFATDTAA
ncbi:hypothetical protein [Frondihabitans australicus]|uniref:STAS domain-containing protein n=1 Tax=Frondihabitans australicus TaxID=386892 RepID=A0A495IDI4_9MICO|nr:hypothetical protein [Frondihabitans australicus]RKR74067.1 hypothetical protein C8E83_1173 [Frondihabitans australicus]